MAGYNKSVVLAVLEEKLQDAKDETDARHKQDVKAFENRRADIQRAKKNVRQAVRDLTEGKIEIEEFAERCNASRSYDHWFTRAAQVVGSAPKRQESARERAFTRVLKVIRSNPAESLTIADLRSLGVLEFVKFDK